MSATEPTIVRHPLHARSYYWTLNNTRGTVFRETPGGRWIATITGGYAPYGIGRTRVEAVRDVLSRASQPVTVVPE